jgi:hypothetical protein
MVMKMRMIKLNPDFLMKTMRGKTNSFASNLPEDTELLDIKHDLFTNQIVAIIRSDSFEDIAESYPIPEFNVSYAPEFNINYAPGKKESQPIISFKTQPEPVISAGPELEVTKEMGIQTSQDTREVEEEFSPEQRKLLSFTVKGEYVIVKPIQFLKAEWEDINDVVRSLDGRWVKGDLGSYWAIPRKHC